MAEIQRAVDPGAPPAGEVRAIALDLIPLLAPHKKHGKLSLRVERLPQQTRLSKGSRNNDGSWSLTRDDLDDLDYLVPDGVEAARTLSVRVVGLVAGNTLAVLEVPVTAEGSAAVEAGRAAVADHDAQAVMLREELAKLKASVAERDAALTELRRSSSGVDEQLAQAREIWQRQAQEAVAAAEREWQTSEAARLREAEARWQAQANMIAAKHAEAEAARSRAVDLEARSLREKIAALEAVLTERDAAHEELKREAREALAAAEGVWRADEAARMAAAEARWREASAKALADADARTGQATNAELNELRDRLAALQAALSERDAALNERDAALARAEAEAGRERESDVEARALREKVAALQAVLAERDGALARADQAREQLQREARDALAAAKNKWRAEEAARAAAAEARWREAAAKELADAGAANERTQDAELGELNEKLAVLQAALTERDEALAHAEELEVERRAQAEQQLHETLTRAEVIWKADEAARLAEAEARWRESIAAAPAAGTDSDAELRALREKLSGVQAKLAEREAALVRANKGADEERLKWQRDAQDAISRATKEWNAKEGSRRAATEAMVRKEMAAQLLQATSRYEAAESALAQIRIRSSSANDSVRADVELSGARAALVQREAELTRLRAEVEALREGAPIVVEGPAVAAPAKRSYVRDAGIAAAIGVVVVVAYPFIESWLTPAPPPAPPPKVVVAPPPPPPKLDDTAVMASDAKLRAGPSTKTGVIAPIAADTDVTVIEDRGDWIRVRAPGKPLREGWVKLEQLRGFTPSAAPAP